MMQLQCTIKKSVSLSGVGLHTGEKVQVTLRPAHPNTGIQFRRVDLADAPSIAAVYSHVIDTRLSTTIGKGSVRVATVEHLLAAVKGMGVDNVWVDVDGPEVPILDGSSSPFCEAIIRAGLESQSVARRTVRIRRRVQVEIGGRVVAVEPAQRLEIDAEIRWDHPMIGKQKFSYRDSDNAFSKIASARTFGLLSQVEQMRAAGLIKGGSLENAIVLSETGVVNPEGLRFADEFVRHKVLDALGDLALAECAILGRFTLVCSGHELHARLLEEVFSNPSNYDVVEGTSAYSMEPAMVLEPLYVRV